MKFESLILVFLLTSFSMNFAQAQYADVALGITQHEDGLGCPLGVKRVRKVYHTTNLNIEGEGRPVVETKDVFGTMVVSRHNSFANGRIRGPYTEGAIAGKTTGNLFFGISNFNDIMGVQTLRDTEQKIIGANIYLSFCEQPPVFTEARKLDNFTTPFEIFVSGGFSFPANVCAFGYAQTYLSNIDVGASGSFPAFKANNTFGPINAQAARQVCAGINHVTTTDGARQVGEQNPGDTPVVTSNPSITTL